MADQTEKLLPQNVEAEAGVLGSILIDADVILQIIPLLRADDFYREAHRAIYQAAVDLASTGAPADFIMICDELARRGKLDEVGGTSYVGSLANQVPTSRNAVHYALIVERAAVNRRIIHAAGKMAAVAYNEADADASLEQAEKLISAIARRRPERDNGEWAATIDEMLTEFLDVMSGTSVGMPSGFERVDRHIVSLRKKELAYVLARPGVGKTLFGAHVAISSAELCAQEQDGCVEWFTMEMSKAQQAKRVIAAETGIDSRVLRAGFMRPDGTIDRAKWQTVVDAAEASKKRLDGRIFVRDASYTVEGLYAQLRKAVTERNCRVAIVDYFGLIKTEGSGKGALRTERMTEISQQLKAIARDLDIPLWVLAQANRESAHRDDPRLLITDFRDTGAGEQDADFMFSLHCPADFDKPRAYGSVSKGIAPDADFAEFCECGVLKARDGQAGVILPLRRRTRFTRLEDWPAGKSWPVDETRPAGVED